jgi:hypothetical protein
MNIFQFMQSICIQGFVSQMQFGTWVFLKFNVVLGCMWFEVIEKSQEDHWAQERDIHY